MTLYKVPYNRLGNYYPDIFATEIVSLLVLEMEWYSVAAFYAFMSYTNASCVYLL